MKITKSEQKGIFFGVIVIIFSFLYKGTPYFTLIFGAGIIIAALPFVFESVRQANIEREKETMFLEFARSLVESVKMGSPVSKSIIILKGKSFGALTPHINKLANQIELGIPLGDALLIFSKDVNNKKISRAITLISQAEKAGGEIGEILESVAEAVGMSDKLKKERKSKIAALVVQGYIIFFVFMIIILIMQFKILPMLSGIASMAQVGGGGMLETTGSPGMDQTKIASAFLNLIIIQGLFSGLIIGKLAEGNIKYGIKHSAILAILAFLIFTIANALF